MQSTTEGLVNVPHATDAERRFRGAIRQAVDDPNYDRRRFVRRLIMCLRQASEKYAKRISDAALSESDCAQWESRWFALTSVALALGPSLLDDSEGVRAMLQSSELQWIASTVIQEAGPAGSEFAPLLLSLVEQGNENVVLTVASVIREDPKLIRAVVRILQGGSLSARRVAGSVLGELGERGTQLVPEIIEALLAASRSEQRALRFQAGVALTNCGAGRSEVLHRLAELSADADPEIAAIATEAMNDSR